MIASSENKHMSETIEILGRRLKLKHLPNGFITSMDSVLLAAACPIKSGQNLLDMGCGVGGAGFCVLERIVCDVHLTGFDIQEKQIELAKLNASVNGYDGCTQFETTDIKDFNNEKAYHHVICNPPYLEKDGHLRSPYAHKATAMGHDVDGGTIGDWIVKAHDVLKSKGTFTLIHRADQIDKIIRSMGKRFGSIEIIPLWPKAGVNAKRVIVRAIKDRRSPTTLHSGIILHDSDGQYTIEANNILKNAEGLFL